MDFTVQYIERLQLNFKVEVTDSCAEMKKNLKCAQLFFCKHRNCDELCIAFNMNETTRSAKGMKIYTADFRYLMCRIFYMLIFSALSY